MNCNCVYNKGMQANTHRQIVHYSDKLLVEVTAQQREVNLKNISYAQSFIHESTPCVTKMKAVCRCASMNFVGI